MSSDIVVKELFRNLENVFLERVRFTEEILLSTRQNNSSSSSESSQGLFSDLEEKMKNLHVSTHESLQVVSSNYEQLVKRVSGMERSIEKLLSTLQTVQTRMENIGNGNVTRLDQVEADLRAANTRIQTLQSQMEDETPVEAAEVEAEIDEAEEAALEEASDEQQEEEEAEEEQPEEEEEESPFEPIFTFEKKDYYQHKDSHDVFIPDDEGNIDPDNVVGIWNPQTEKMWDLTRKKWWDPKTNKYTEAKKKN